MKLLALDTSSDACSVALDREGKVIERHVLRPKEHTRLLLPMIEEVLAEAGVAIPDLDAIVTGIGPGSFIGVRIAVSVTQGVAFATGRRVVAASSLAAVAAEAFAGGDVERVVVAQDAHRQEVYLARFARGRGGMPEPVGQPVLQGMTAIDALSGPEAGRWHAAGAGWRRQPKLLGQNENLLAGLLPLEYPRASFLLAVGRAAVRAGSTLDPCELAPAYVRHQVAKVPGSGETEAP